MARPVGNDVPPPIQPLLAGRDLAALEGLTFLLLTVSGDGWPHLAMLSAGEVVATGPRELRLAAWAASTAAGNLARERRCSLALVHGGAAWTLRCSVSPGPVLEVEGSGPLASFSLLVEQAFEDRAPYAELTGGVTFRLGDRDATLRRWERTIAALRNASPGPRGQA